MNSHKADVRTLFPLLLVLTLLAVPVLTLHGEDDETVPVSVSRELAERRPDIVTYVEFAEAGHVGSWNVDPELYERAIREFLNDNNLGSASP